MQPVPSFALEQDYRERFSEGMFDLSSSSPQPLSVTEVLEAAGANPSSLLIDPLEYEPGGGSHRLREGVTRLYDGIRSDDVLITAGAAEAIRVAVDAAIRPGDDAIVQRPTYQALRVAASSRGARITDWLPGPGFQFNYGDLPRLADASTTTILLNNPHGPTGTVAIGRYHGAGRLIADEVYRPVALTRGFSPRSVVDDFDRAVSIGDLSKPLGLGGLRVGWIVSRDRAFIERCRIVLDFYSGSVSALSARVATAALDQFDALLERQVCAARANYDTLTRFVEAKDGWLDWLPPQAGYTAFLRLRRPTMARTLRDRMLARGVFTLGGDVFEAPDHLRVGFGRDSELFSEALGVLGSELQDLVGPHRAPSPDGEVIVLAKHPSGGNTKTRLAAGIGADRTLALCEAFVRDTFDFATPRARRLYIAATPSSATGEFQRSAPNAHCFAQPEADFGQRLGHAFDTAIAAGARRPVLIGTDSPTLPSHLLSVAHRALETHDVVIGPADDGGYYLIGMNVTHAALFDGIDWSTDLVFEQTLARARKLRASVFVLPPWYDVDTSADLDRLIADPMTRRHTRHVVTTLASPLVLS